MKKFILLFMVLISILSGVACTSSATPAFSDSEIEAIRKYADPATRTTLEGLSENNMAKYTQYGDEQYKAAVTQDVFNLAYGQIMSQLGSFESITFLSVESKDGYTVVHYRAKYSGGEVGVRMVFNKDQKISGQWFE